MPVGGEAGRAARFVAWVLWTALSVRAQTIITTFAGSDYHFDGDGKRAIQAPLGHVSAVAVDNQGRVYVADPDNHMVLRFTPNGTLNVIAGNGIAGNSGDGGPATSASLSNSGRSCFRFDRQPVHRRCRVFRDPHGGSRWNDQHRFRRAVGLCGRPSRDRPVLFL